MRTPIRWDLFGDRGVDFADTIPIVGQDFTGATFTSQIRAVPDASGSPLVTLTVALGYGGSATVAAHIAAGRITAEIYNYRNPATNANYVAGDTIAVSLINVSAAAPRSAIPAASPTGADYVCAWDMLIDPSGAAPKDKWIYGSYTERGTVTQ
jgi:hypothetical protein